jgi:uncharacterized membrane protein YphA (DoxX/SURF4 family)
MTVLAVVVARTPDPVDARMDTWLLFLIAARSRGLTTTALRGQPMVDDRRSIMTHTMHRLMQWEFHPPTDAAPPATLLIRLMAGGVFVGEGLLKFVFPATLGVGRFHALGIPAPELMATFVGLVEIVGGLLFLLGWFTRLAAIGRRTGVAHVLGVNFSGFLAWWLWRTVYLSKLPRFEKKLRVALDWTLDLFFAKDLVQFITSRAPTIAYPAAGVLPSSTGHARR